VSPILSRWCFACLGDRRVIAQLPALLKLECGHFALQTTRHQFSFGRKERPREENT
jgi:hypothetical protein